MTLCLLLLLNQEKHLQRCWLNVRPGTTLHDVVDVKGECNAARAEAEAEAATTSLARHQQLSISQEASDQNDGNYTGTSLICDVSRQMIDYTRFAFLVVPCCIYMCTPSHVL